MICDSKSDIELLVGKVLNVVLGKVIYIGKYFDKLKKEFDKLNFEYIVEGNKICIIGKSVYLVVSDIGINVVVRFCIVFNNIGIDFNIIKFLVEVIGEDVNGNNIIFNCKDDVLGKLIVNIGRVIIDNEKEFVGIDVRILVIYKKDDFVKELKKMIDKYNLNYEEYDFLDLIYVLEDIFFVKIFRKVYEEEIGFDGILFLFGGVIYVRVLDNCVVFGVIFLGKLEIEY